MGLMKVPELVQEISNFVENPRDLAQLAQVDRFTNAAVTPYLYRYIDIPLDFVKSLAITFKNRLDLAAKCRFLSFCCLSNDLLNEDKDEGSSEDHHVPYESLVTIFSVLAQCGTLSTLRWDWEGRHRGRFVRFPSEVWEAISGVSVNLRELDISIRLSNQDAWLCITQTSFPNLHVLKLDITDAHGWDFEHLQKFRDTLSDLEELSLFLPICCGPFGLTLHSTHPRLKRFSLSSSRLLRGLDIDFLVRHPAIEYLYLETEQPLVFSSASQLRALSIDSDTLLTSPGAVFSHAQLTHLRLRRMPDPCEPRVGDAVRAVASSLRCLEFDEVDEDEYAWLLEHILPLLHSTPVLEELGILGSSDSPPSLNRTADDLRDLLAVLADVVSLIALRVADHYRTGELLPPTLLDDFGYLPPRLEYIGWDVTPRSVVYGIERIGCRNVGRAVLVRQPGSDWVSESVLERLS
ncbi:hypothetical protein B0H19DRAFT_1140232 [Mycena capillaripes]|nr:hypothetical protein B0H19DRAFT_1140232 [Mycena capillaripes]